MQKSSFRSLQGEKIAVLVANGFNERDLTEVQRVLQEYGAHIRIISMDGGLVNSWNGTSWGLNFAADSMLNEALAVDYSMLLVPGGRRSADKLKLTAHTRRFVNGFLDADKPLALCGEVVELLAHIEKIAGRRVSVADEYKEEAERAGAICDEGAFVVDANLLSFNGSEEAHADFAQEVVAHFAGAENEQQQAA